MLSPIDYYILKIFKNINTGEVKFKTKIINRLDFLYALSKAKVPLLKITLIPGETKELFFQSIAKKLDINYTKLLNAYNNDAPYLEASIIPDTYFIPKKMNEKKLIHFLLKSSHPVYRKIFKNYGIENNRTKQLQILIIASIIQKESANKKEMPVVASVIYNRLKKNMRLQMDGTLNYGKYSHIKVTSKRIKTDTSHFNTYKHKGLPNYPIGSVSKEAINSAFAPANTNYLYFMRNSQGVHDFSKTFKAHKKNIRKVKFR